MKRKGNGLTIAELQRRYLSRKLKFLEVIWRGVFQNYSQQTKTFSNFAIIRRSVFQKCSRPTKAFLNFAIKLPILNQCCNFVKSLS